MTPATYGAKRTTGAAAPHAQGRDRLLRPVRPLRRRQQVPRPLLRALSGTDTFRQTYNEERPHEALGQQPPARYYHASFRSYPSRGLSAPEYEVNGVTVRKVVPERSNGEIKSRKGDKRNLPQ